MSFSIGFMFRVAGTTGIATGLGAKILTNVSFGRAFTIGTCSVLAESLALLLASYGEETKNKTSKSYFWHKAFFAIPISLISVVYLSGITRSEGIKLVTVAMLATIFQVYHPKKEKN